MKEKITVEEEKCLIDTILRNTKGDVAYTVKMLVFFCHCSYTDAMKKVSAFLKEQQEEK